MPQTPPDRMTMVYNADEGLFNALNDWAHKFFSPETYECPLCRYTYGLTGMLSPWKTFIENQPFPTTFLYRPEFWKAYPGMRSLTLPLILVEKQGVVDVLVSADEIKNTGGLMTLINLVQARLEGWRPAADGRGIATPVTP
ncbi:MAG: hypothetical protein ACREH8_08345 [Opitutaceae bacterium]